MKKERSSALQTNKRVAEKAIKIGLDFFGPKMKSIIESVESLVAANLDTVQNGSRIVLLYCWRGGMRSGGVAWLLDLYGFKVYTLIGGYKKFRNYVLDTFRLPISYKIIGGYTGSGKTEVLKALKEKGQPIVDLESIAHHKGSAFGDISMPKQPGQEMFENKLATEIRSLTIDHLFHHPDSSIWLEDESQRIGFVNIPHDLWIRMREFPLYFLEIPFEERLEHILQEYGSLDRQALIDAIGRIREKLGGLQAKTAIQLLEEGNTRESFRILLKYYDRFYFKSLHNRKALNSLLCVVPRSSVTPENAAYLVQQPEYYSEKS